MNTTTIVAIASELAKLNPQEHLIASELAQAIRAGGKSLPIKQAQEPSKPAARISQKFLHWSEEDTLILMQFEEDSKNMSAYERRRRQKQLCRQFGRSASAVKNKLWKIRNGVK